MEQFIFLKYIFISIEYKEWLEISPKRLLKGRKGLLRYARNDRLPENVLYKTFYFVLYKTFYLNNDKVLWNKVMMNEKYY